jgi:uncharacterized protein YjbI with pentapeptide repeats
MEWDVALRLLREVEPTLTTALFSQAAGPVGPRTDSLAGGPPLRLSRSDLRGVDLRGVDLRWADLEGADLREAQLSHTDLGVARLLGADLRGALLDDAELGMALLDGADARGARLTGARLANAVLRGADLRGADLSLTIFQGADLRGALLDGADLTGADLTESDLRGAALRRAGLEGANLDDCLLAGVDLRGARFGMTRLASLDLTEVAGLAETEHTGPSSIGTDTLYRSQGRIPPDFLRGCGLTPWEALWTEVHDVSLSPARLSKILDRILDAWAKGRSMINGCFISYSWKDAKFVGKLRDRLLSEGINVWLDRHDMVAGTIQDQVWRAIQSHQVVILVLSKDSLQSDWVENELEMARAKERAEGRAVLCPIALDDAWLVKVEAKSGPGDPSRQLWRTVQQKLVVDFSRWKTRAFDASFARLRRGLIVNYEPGVSAAAASGVNRDAVRREKV